MAYQENHSYLKLTFIETIFVSGTTENLWGSLELGAVKNPNRT